MGMGGEAVDASKLGTLLIMFVAVVAIALAAFLVGKGLMNTGVDNLETTAGKINDSRFSDYNNKNIRGRAVKQAIDNFANEEVAILINNLAFNGVNGSASNLTVAQVSAAIADTSTGTNYNMIGISSNNGTSIDKGNVVGYATNGQSKTGGVAFVNYNAVLKLGAAGSESTLGTGAVAPVDAIYKDDATGTYVYLRDFQTTNGGDIRYYLKTTDLGKKGNTQYIADTASYQASLMKNSSGEIMGIVFVQRKVG